MPNSFKQAVYSLLALELEKLEIPAEYLSILHYEFIGRFCMVEIDELPYPQAKQEFAKQVKDSLVIWDGLEIRIV